MTLKRLTNTFSAVAGTVLVVGGAMFLIATWRESTDTQPEERILNVRVHKETANRGIYVPITVNADGEFVIDDQVMPDEVLLKKLKTMARVSSDADVRIRGDDDTSWEVMIRAVDLIETSGLTNVTFATRKPDPE